MRRQIASVLSVGILLLVASTTPAYADDFLGATKVWRSSNASGSGERITVEASKGSRGQAKRQVVRARGSGKAFTGVVREQPKFLVFEMIAGQGQRVPRHRRCRLSTWCVGC